MFGRQTLAVATLHTFHDELATWRDLSVLTCPWYVSDEVHYWGVDKSVCLLHPRQERVYSRCVHGHA